MNALLEKIGVAEVQRPEFDNGMLGISESVWIRRNAISLTYWWMALQEHEEVIDLTRVAHWLHAQYQIELIRRERKNG